MTAKLSGLNSPLVIRGKMLKSRFMYPIAQVHFLQGPELYPADPTVSFYEKIAKNGCALVLTQDTTNPDQRKMPGHDTPHFSMWDMDSQPCQNYFCQLTEFVHMQNMSEKQLQRLADEKDVGLHEAALEGLRSRTGEADARARELQTAIEAAKAKIEANALKIAEMERVRGDNQQKIAAAEETIRSANAARLEKEAAISKLGQDNRALTDERERMSGEMARLAERRTAAETELNDTNSKLWEEYQLTESEARSQCVPFESLTELRRSVTEVRGKIRALGNVNVGAIDEYKEVRERYDFLKAQVTDVEKAKAELTKMIAELCSEMQELFTASFKQINANFQQIFKELFGGGHARLYLSDEANVLESGIEIEVSPPGKVIKNLSALSGGEQALVAISIYFAILRVNPAPFCFLDEIEAALDDVNVARYAQYLRRMTDRTQFIVITHRRGTMEAADVLYGVTMQEDGVSKILRLDLDNVSADLIT